jgi:hypothetical protein
MSVLTLMSWKTTAALLLGLATQGCGFVNDFSKSDFMRNAEQHIARTADRMAYQEEIRRYAFESPIYGEERDYERVAKKTFQRVGQATLKAGWQTLTQNTSIDGIIEPSFKDDEGRIIPTEGEPGLPEQPKQKSNYRLGLMPVVRVGNEVGGGLKVRNASAIALRGDNYWEYRATANLLQFRIAAEYLDHDIEKDRLKFGIGRGPFSVSFSEGPNREKEYWIEFFK